jgi:putative FmdB family regulatory protein
MPYSDYRCNVCGNVFDYYKKSFVEDFPSTIICNKCESEAKRIYSRLVFDIAEGKCGNSKSGYKTGMTYHPGSIVGKMKGKKIK